MSDDYIKPAVSKEYNVEMPNEKSVYYDTILGTTMTVHEVGDEFVTYVVEQEVDNVHSDPHDRFLAWLAAERFVKLGERDQEGTLIIAEEELNKVFKMIYGLAVEGQDPHQIAATAVEEKIGDQIKILS